MQTRKERETQYRWLASAASISAVPPKPAGYLASDGEDAEVAKARRMPRRLPVEPRHNYERSRKAE
jgi:hypothetical protein